MAMIDVTSACQDQYLSGSSLPFYPGLLYLHVATYVLDHCLLSLYPCYMSIHAIVELSL
jgi:hypothetical protein